MRQNKIRKILSIIGFVFGILILFSAYSINVKAHSPSNMNLSYDSGTNTLNVTISHQVSNENVHYINEIEININGEFYETFEYNDQPSKNSFTYSINQIDADIGDSIEVIAICNQGGQITRSLTVSEENGKSTSDDSSPGFELLVFLISFVIVIILLRNRPKAGKKK